MLVKQKGLLLVVSAGTLIILLTVVTLFSERIDFQSSVALAYQRFQELNPWGGSGSDDGQKAVDEDLLKLTEKVDLSPEQDPFEEKISEPEGPLVRPGANSSEPVKATLLSLVRNEELKEILASIRQIESTFNDKFHYPWTFFNDEEFTDQFKQQVQEVTKSECEFVKINPEDWEEPSWIDREKAERLGLEMKEKEKVQHAEQQSYHRMCRWNSGKFYVHPALDKYDFYWRVEPKTNYFCDLDYDVFAYMQDHDKDYGFVINLYDSPESIRSLWPTTVEFFQKHPDYLHKNNALQWLVHTEREDHNNVTEGYSTCHFWSNFEIGRLEFYRSQAYQDYFDYLDHAGGFFYERWGDAPVHSVALGLMLDKERIHWFRDIGYYHPPYYNCPKSDKCKGCVPGKFSQFNGLDAENCLNEWFKAAGKSWQK
uniref:ARAD1D37400p n=1 Tax=Blastobotrys adeninivorans TaxID=409370 RepID=A0A060THB0_BLAAD